MRIRERNMKYPRAIRRGVDRKYHPTELDSTSEKYKFHENNKMVSLSNFEICLRNFLEQKKQRGEQQCHLFGVSLFAASVEVFLRTALSLFWNSFCEM